MPTEDHSNPFAVAQPTMTSMVNAVIALSAETKALREATNDLKGEVRDLRQERTRWVTREELHEHAQQCPGNPRGERKRPPSSGLTKIGVWATAQQRLGVIVSILTLLGLVGGGLWWGFSTASTVRERLVHSERLQKRRDADMKREVKKNLREVLKALREGD